jgi:asparagine synthase (glutamine-hydrolysing)
MCGIAGIFNLNGEKVPESYLEKMSLCMKERGPDNLGIWTSENAGLVHRRLSIIDLSANGNQPMQDTENTVVITFNGEIYNFPELKEELQKKGILFNTSSDTEVLLYGYKVWGIEHLLNKIDGMFAFVLCDLQKRKSFLCRDRFGKKPLYYSIDNGRFYFSSDIRSITPFISNLEMDYEALDYYLTEICIPQPKTIWKNIAQVYKSSFLELDLNSGEHSVKEYFRLVSTPKLKISYDEAEKLVEQNLTAAILKRTISDVPVGCFLSGGVDSGLVVSLLAQQSAKPVKTFSVGFTEDDFNELPYAQKLAERYGTDHTEIIIQPKIENEIHDLVDYYGEPFADSSAIPTYYVCKEMRKHVTVALSGDGGDELFGYRNYAYAKKAEDFMRNYPAALQRNFVTMLSKMSSRLKSDVENYGALDKFCREEASGIALIRGMAFMPHEMSDLYSHDFKNKVPGYAMKEAKKIWSKYEDCSLTDKIFLASLDTRLLNDYLVKVDRSSMKSSLEVRSPFLDTELAALAFKLPYEYKIKNGEAKYILKKLAQKHIDKNIFDRKKQGFGIPVKHWLKNELKELVAENLSEKQVSHRGFFNPHYVTKLLKEHNSNKINHTHKIWSLLWLELWCKKFLKS